MINEDKFLIYYNYLVEENKKYNLTSITEKEEAYIKHFEDSLAMDKTINLSGDIKVCDVGSGAGFPGIPLKIEHSNIDLTIIEPTKKRAEFLSNIVNILNLNNVHIYNERAEDYGKKKRSEFDVVCARAVSETPILLELLAPLCKVGGRIILYKGEKGLEELDASKKALKELNLSVQNIYKYSLSKNMGNRVLVIITKDKEINNKYPRRYAEIKHKPL